MIIFHAAGERGVECSDLGHCHKLMNQAVWIDLYKPTEQEEIIVDMAFSIDLPTRSEMQDIEVSRRLYKVDSDLFMTANILTKSETGHPESNAVTFIYTDNRLVTLRYSQPHPFETFRAERESDLGRYDSGQRNFEGLIEAIIERIADLLENAGANLDSLSNEIFRATQQEQAASNGPGKAPEKPRKLEEVLRHLGRVSDLISRVRESMAGLGRMLSFFLTSQKDLPPDLAEHLRTLQQDLQPLSDHASFLAQKVSFLLDATLGLINIEQNAIIKVFTIAAVLALPPTLVGTVYGMNFEAMPELKWAWGYPLCVILMIASAIAPYYYFKRRGWF
jgi:magnesium transporter